MKTSQANARFFDGMALLIIATVICFLVLPNFLLGGSTGHHDIPHAKSDLAVLCGAIDQFRRDMGRYPTDEEGLSALDSYPLRDGKRWRGPYLKQDLSKDPWGNPYVYTLNETEEGEKFQVMSYGADGKPGGEGDNADLVDGS